MVFLDNKAPTILVVEDDDVAREMMVECIASRGYRVVSADNGARAVRVALASPPDVVILDLGLPVMDGYEALRRMRAQPNLEKVYVIALSAFLNGRERQLAFEAGCNEYITKPCGEEVVAGALHAYFVKRGDIVVEPVMVL